jgi:hypothetical protein
LQDFAFALDILEYLEVRFGKQNFVSKQDTDTKVAKGVSIHNEVVKLKQLGLLSAEVDDKSRIDEVLK